jgi:hypothetical protein
MRVRRGVPWFPLDALKMGLHVGAPSLGVHPEQDDLETADRMWPVVKVAFEHLIFDGRDYLAEGCHLRPQMIARFIEETDAPVSVCFLGYPDVEIETKMAQMKRHAGGPNDWLNRMDPEEVRRYLKTNRSLSGQLREDCKKAGIPFFDTGVDFEAGLASAERALVGLPPAPDFAA